MQTLGLSNSERNKFHRALRSSHTRRVVVSVTNLEGNTLSVVSHRLLDGQVLVDMDADVTRSATLSLLDRKHSLNFDTDSPDDGALYADRMIRIEIEILVEDLGRHVSVPVFHGPVTKLDRKGDVVDIECQGKESLALGAVWRPITLKKGTKKTDAIRTLMSERAGETRFAFPTLTARLPKAVTLDRYSPVWASARKIASGMNRQLYYTAGGVLKLRAVPDRPVFTFKTGTGGDILSDVAISNLMEDVKNVVVVKGGKPKGAKNAVRATAVAEDSHPLSPRRLGRNGVPRYLVELVENESIRTDADARERAKQILRDRLRSTVEVTFDALPIPHLDAGDLVRVETDDASFEFRLRQFSIPLGVSGDPVMSVGYHRRTTVNRRRIRR